MVEGVKHLRPELEHLRFCDLRFLQERYIPVVDARATQGISAEVAKGCNRTGSEVQIVVELAVERRGIEVKVPTNVASNRIWRCTRAVCCCPGERAYLTSVHCPNLSDQVRAIQKVALETVVVVRKDCKRLPRLKRADDVDLPALRRAPRERITIPEWPVDRQLPACADNKTVRRVEVS